MFADSMLMKAANHGSSLQNTVHQDELFQPEGFATTEQIAQQAGAAY